MKEFRSCLRHRPFLDVLGRTEPHSELWREASAGLHFLRILDVWLRRRGRRSRVSQGGIREVRTLVSARGGKAAAPLLAAIDVIESDAPESEFITAKALLEYARSLHLEMEWTLAIDVCETAVDRVGMYMDAALLLETLAQLASSVRASGQFEEARLKYLELGRVARSSGSRAFALRARVGLANLLMERGNYPKAESMIDDVIRSATARSDNDLNDVLSRALHTRSTISQGRGRSSEAVEFGRQALELCANPVERDSILHDIAVAFISLGCLSAARDALLVVQKRALYRDTRWTAGINLMEIAALQGCAVTFENSLRNLSDQRMRPWHRTHFLYLAGEGYERLGRYGQALEMYNAAILEAESCGVNEVVIRAEARSRDVQAGKYLAKEPGTPQVCRDVARIIEAVADLRTAAGIPVGVDDP